MDRVAAAQRFARATLVVDVISTLLVGALASASAQSVDPGFFSGLHWRSIGPYRSGNVAAVAGVPGDPTVYYAGMPEAGVWKTTDGGTVWTPIFDSVHIASVGAIAVAQSNPDIVYVATGDPSGWSFTPGNGVYKSTDAGRSWRNVGLGATRYINDIIVDPANPNIVVVGALGAAQAGGRPNPERGVYRTADGGVTWQHVLSVDAYTGVRDLVADAGDPHIVFAAFQRSAFGISPAERAKLEPLGTGIYKSTDGGATWTPVRGNGLPASATSFDLAVAAHGMRVYAEAQGTGRDAGGIYRSDDGGATWMLGTKEIGSAGGRIYVDPKNPDVVYLMGTSMYRSLDGGRTFVSYKGAPGGDDNRELWIDPTNSRRMLMGADQGPTISVDGGETWTPWYNLPNGQFYNVVTDDDFPYHVCGSQQDSGTACVASRSDYGRIRENDWYAIGGFERGDIVPDPRNSRWVYTQGWYHVLRRYDRTTGQVVVLYTPTPEDRFGGLPPMAFSPQDSHLLYMGAQYILASSDGGRTWRHVSPDLTATMRAEDTTAASPSARRRFAPAINTLAPSRVKAGEIWAGTNNGVVQVTRDAGRSWTNITPSELPARAVVEVLEPSHRDDGTAYAAVSAPGDDHPYIYRTTDFGKHWTPIVSGLPNDALVRVVREDPVAPDVLYAGTVTGAWVSFDRGDHWESLQLNLPNTVVSDIAVHGSDLAISTYGRGLWILDDITPLRQARTAVSATRSASAYLYSPVTTYRVRWDNDQDTPRPPEVPAGENAPEGAILYYYLSSAPQSITVSIRDGAGALVREFTTAPPPPSLAPNVPEYWFEEPTRLSNTPGMHRIVWDLRHPDPKILPYGYYGDLLTYTEYTLTWHAVKGHTPRVQPPGPLVAPGKYQVELAVDGHRYAQPLTIVNDPRVNVPQADLLAQLQAEQRITAGMATSYAGFEQVQQLRTGLARISHNESLQADLAAAANAMDTTLAQLATGARMGFGIANRDLARHLEDADFGDLRPTASNLAAIEANCRQVDAALGALQHVITTDVPRMNSMLQRDHLQDLPNLTPMAGPACGASAQHFAASAGR